MAGRLPRLRRFAKRGRFDLVLAHGSHEAMLTARSLRIPAATSHDYEFATLQHQLGLRAATRVVFPEAIPAERLARFGVRPPKLVRYPGDRGGVLPRRLRARPERPARGSTRARCSPSCARRRSWRSTTATANPLFADVLDRLGRDEYVHAVVLPRTAEQRAAIAALGLPSLHVPEQAIDAQSLVALADLVVSAGGTMNREAVALGTPVYTTFAGRLGAVDETLIRVRAADARSPLRRSDLRKRDSDEPPRIRRATRGFCSTAPLSGRLGPTQVD